MTRQLPRYDVENALTALQSDTRAFSGADRRLFRLMLDSLVVHIWSVVVRSRSIIRIALVTATLLLVPLVTMQFSDEVGWDLGDFVVGGALLFGAGLIYELFARRGGTVAYRAAVGGAVGAALLLVWISLAVWLP